MTRPCRGLRTYLPILPSGYGVNPQIRTVAIDGSGGAGDAIVKWQPGSFTSTRGGACYRSTPFRLLHEISGLYLTVVVPGDTELPHTGAQAGQFEACIHFACTSRYLNSWVVCIVVASSGLTSIWDRGTQMVNELVPAVVSSASCLRCSIRTPRWRLCSRWHKVLGAEVCMHRSR
jgi:hypothetical protein